MHDISSVNNKVNKYLNYLKNNKLKILGLVFIISLFFLFGGCMTYAILSDDIEEQDRKIELLQQSLDNKYIKTEIETVNKSLDDLKKDKPVLQTNTHTTTTEIRYVEKQTPEDPDVSINKQKPVAKIQYNDKTYDVPLQTTSKSETQPDGTVKVTEQQKLTIDVTDVANRQIAAYKLNMDAKQKELNDELAEVKKDRRVYKGALIGVGVIGAGYLINKALK